MAIPFRRLAGNSYICWHGSMVVSNRKCSDALVKVRDCLPCGDVELRKEGVSECHAATQRFQLYVSQSEPIRAKSCKPLAQPFA